MRVPLFALAAIAALGCDSNKTDEKMGLASAEHPRKVAYGAIEQRFKGPGLVCGEAFALKLGEQEHVTRRDPQIDFVTYRVEGPAGSLTIYEGNHPQPGGIVHEVENDGWTQLVVVHESEPDPSYARDVSKRLLLGTQHGRLCAR